MDVLSRCHLGGGSGQEQGGAGDGQGEDRGYQEQHGEVAGVVEASQQEVRSVADVSASAQLIAIAALVVSVVGLAGGCMAVTVMVRERRG